MAFPEWLIFEIENNLRIRKDQGELAKEMMWPADDQNTMMQLNMGEGKSSVIIPIIAASLATGSNLVRLIITKPQSAQMAQNMTTRLGGLLDRRIYYLPFSRAFQPNEDTIPLVLEIISECIEKKGILFVLPEHVSSFNLILADSSKKRTYSVKKGLYDIKQLKDSICRDIIDESDDIFSPKYELVYPLGKEQPVDFAKERCRVIPQLLKIVRQQARTVSEAIPGGLNFTCLGPGRYPHVVAVTKKASELLNYRVATEVCRLGLEGFAMNLKNASPSTRERIVEYITKAVPSEAATQCIRQQTHWGPKIKKLLHLLRGLLAENVLSAALQDRFRVHYGLDKTRRPRTDLAVPYRAKDTPSISSEYSRVDTNIIKAYLAYYYQGLDDNDLFATLKHLLQSDNAHYEYQYWVKGASGLPKMWHDVTAINLKDTEACKRDLFPHLRFGEACIDYYLSHLVFPKQLREYSEKVSVSGWDIGRPKKLPSTGFSGTHDLWPLLPLPVTQRDLDSQRHVDALVLVNMLAAPNSILCLGPPNQEGISEEFLNRIIEHQPPLRVIVDVGAHLVDLTNLRVAQQWLHMLQKKAEPVEAAVYCNDEDELTVLDSHGKTQSLRLSPYAKRMDRCVIFLDEAHSRGIDLKLPPAYRAAITLGSGLTKDKLAQACMRMRLLGQTQFVTFCVPNGIEKQIRLYKNRSANQQISIEDVICWTIGQTFEELSRFILIWAKQGCQFARQTKIWTDVLNEPNIELRKRDLNKLKEADVQTIEEQYQPREGSTVLPADSDDEMVTKIRERLEQFQCLSTTDHSHSEEREVQREMEMEIEIEAEQERQVQRAKSATPAKHAVHRDVEYFVRTGKFRQRKDGIFGAFESLSDTTAAGGHFKVKQFPTRLKVSKDFANVVRAAQGATRDKADFYKRDVHHILTTADKNGIVTNMVLISPFEAEALYKKVKASNIVAMHLYTAWRNVSYAPTDDLRLYVIPEHARNRRISRSRQIELNLFAGQLYFKSFGDYVNTCSYLGLAWNDSFTNVDSDGFISPKRLDNPNPWRLNAKTSPVAFLKSLITNVRHYGGNIEKTHVGRMLNGEFLTKADFPDDSKRKRVGEEGDEKRVVKRERANEDAAALEGPRVGKREILEDGSNDCVMKLQRMDDENEGQDSALEANHAGKREDLADEDKRVMQREEIDDEKKGLDTALEADRAAKREKMDEDTENVAKGEHHQDVSVKKEDVEMELSCFAEYETTI